MKGGFYLKTIINDIISGILLCGSLIISMYAYVFYHSPFCLLILILTIICVGLFFFEIWSEPICNKFKNIIKYICKIKERKEVK